jgi:hypothetical protein
MRISRRHVIKVGLCAAASVLTFDPLASVVLAAEPTDSALWDDDLSWLRRDMFEAVVGASFTVYLPQGGSVTLKLTRVEDVLTAQNAGTVNSADCYAVLLEGSSRTPKLDQDTYRVENRTLGTFPLFLVPGRASKKGNVTYTATFNRVPAN